ncbi:MAG: SDR family NAD(P)-dependent oxidoreductase [Gammaproteobacteria bacterium]
MSASYPSLLGRSVFVTGGGSGIGASIVEHLCLQGARVAFADIDREMSDGLVRALGDAGHEPPLFIECNLTDIDALRRAIDRARDAHGPIRALINNAANDERHAMADVTPQYWDERMAVNLRHQFFAAQAVHEQMAAAGGGSIVNLGSTSWMAGQGGMPAYTTAKSAVMGLTRSLARDMGENDIRVNCVVPGWIMTERQQQLWLTPEAEGDLLQRQCLKRKLYPADIARVVVFFASDESSGCTAQSYIVDAGWI